MTKGSSGLRPEATRAGGKLPVPAGQSIQHNAWKLANSGVRRSSLICAMSCAPGLAGCAVRTEGSQGHKAAMNLEHESRQFQRAAREGSWPRSPRGLLRAGCGRYASSAPCSQPPCPPPPRGSLISRLAAENKPTTKAKACFACGASRRVVLHRSPKRGTPITVKAALRRALRGLDGFGAGAVREGPRGHGAVVHDGPVPPGLTARCARRQTRRAQSCCESHLINLFRDAK